MKFKGEKIKTVATRKSTSARPIYSLKGLKTLPFFIIKYSPASDVIRNKNARLVPAKKNNSFVGMLKIPNIINITNTIGMIHHITALCRISSTKIKTSNAEIINLNATINLLLLL
jgi:hypothetical protein